MADLYRYILLLLLSFIGMHCFSQEKTIRQRFRNVDMWHCQAGLDVSVNKNYCIAPVISVGVGSFRNWYCLETGVGFQFFNSLKSNNTDDISLQQFCVFGTGELHPLRWKNGCPILGGRLSYVLPISAQYVNRNSSHSKIDGRIGNKHATIRAFVGILVHDWKIVAYYEYDMSPSFHQKYVFESTKYNFEAVRTQIYERQRTGLSLTYLFTL